MTATPMERMHAMFEDISVQIANLLAMHAGVTLSRHDDGWHCDHVEPIVWFGDAFLSTGRGLGLGPWQIRGGYVRLHATNGEWLWKLTDDYRTESNCEGALTQRRGVWPD